MPARMLKIVDGIANIMRLYWFSCNSKTWKRMEMKVFIYIQGELKSEYLECHLLISADSVPKKALIRGKRETFYTRSSHAGNTIS